MTKCMTIALLICSALSAIATSQTAGADDGKGNWRQYSQQPNGDIYFYDVSRVESDDNLHRVWNRIRYKTSVMGAPSYQSLLEINCSERTERILQNTFFSDEHWEKPAMKTDKTQKPKRAITKDSASARLSGILCDS